MSARMVTNILGISGSIRRHSTNTRLLQTIAAFTYHRPEVNFQVNHSLQELPHYDPDRDLTGNPLPQAVVQFRQECRQAQAILFACPEYGHSIPGVLKNALDWLVSSGELSAKPVAVTNAYSNRQRGWRGLGVLLQSLGAMDAHIVGITSAQEAHRPEGLVQRQIEGLISAAQS